MVAAAGPVVCLETLSKCTAYSGVGKEINMSMNTAGCWNDNDRRKTVLLTEHPVQMSLCHHTYNAACHIKLYLIRRIVFVKYARKFTPLEFQSFSDSLS
jgi:hypothetical protein